jgi:hypothetical protein
MPRMIFTFSEAVKETTTTTKKPKTNKEEK